MKEDYSGLFGCKPVYDSFSNFEGRFFFRVQHGGSKTEDPGDLVFPPLAGIRKLNLVPLIIFFVIHHNNSPIKGCGEGVHPPVTKTRTLCSG